MAVTATPFAGNAARPPAEAGLSIVVPVFNEGAGLVGFHARLRAAREAGDVDEGPLSMGQDAGLIRDIPPAAELVKRIAAEAEEILSRTLPRLLAS